MRSKTILSQSAITVLIFTAFLGCRTVERSQSMLLSQNTVKTNSTPAPTPITSPTPTATSIPSPSPTPQPGGVATSGTPVIFYTDIISGPNTGGENNNGVYLSIFGKNFGSDLSRVKVYVGTGEVARYMYLGPSLGRPDVQQVSVQLGQGTSTGAVKVLVDGIPSNTDHQFTIRPGNLYFISHSGADTGTNAGQVNNFQRPFRTAGYVWQLSTFGAGDFIIPINDGVYDFASGQEGLWGGYGSGAWILFTKSGTSEINPITIYGYPGADAVTFKISVDHQYLFKSSTRTPVQHIHVANLKVDTNHHKAISLMYGFYSTPNSDRVDYPRIVNYWVYNCLPNWAGTSGMSCISLQNADHLKMYGVQVGPQSNVIDSTNGGHVIYQSHRYTNADAGWLYLHDFQYCRGAYQIAGDSWTTPRAASWGANTNVRVHDSLFVNLAREAILLNLGAKEVFVYNNIIDTVATMSNSFSPIALRGAEINQGTYYLYNNTVYTDALSTDMPGSNAIIEMGYSPQSTYPEHITLYNNIFFAKSSATRYYKFSHSSFGASQVTSDHNIWFSSSSGLPPFAGANDRIVDPGISNILQGDFSLIESSTARGNGTSLVSDHVLWNYDGILRPSSGVNVGAY